MRSSDIAWIKLSATLSSHETITLTDSWPHFPKVGRHTHNSPCVLHIGRKASARHILLSASDTPCSWLSESEAMFSSSTLTKLLTRSGRVLIETRLRGRLFPYLLPLREVLRKPNVHYALAPPEDPYTWSGMQGKMYGAGDRRWRPSAILRPISFNFTRDATHSAGNRAVQEAAAREPALRQQSKVWIFTYHASHIPG
jgi:hypothetical protein